jgi:chromosome segregation ATPase
LDSTQKDRQQLSQDHSALSVEVVRLRQDYADTDSQREQVLVENTQLKEAEKRLCEESNRLKSELENSLKILSDDQAVIGGLNSSLLEARRDRENLSELLLDQQKRSEQSAKVVSALEAGSQQLGLELDEFARDKERAVYRLASLESELAAASGAITSLSQAKASLEAQLADVQSTLVAEVAAVVQLQRQYDEALAKHTKEVDGLVNGVEELQQNLQLRREMIFSQSLAMCVTAFVAALVRGLSRPQQLLRAQRPKNWQLLRPPQEARTHVARPRLRGLWPRALLWRASFSPIHQLNSSLGLRSPRFSLP